jgi:patatin-like phospholipase/acyl hydrolase
VESFLPSFLAEIEARTGEPVSNLFDFFAGTSTGGMLALSLNCPDPPDRLRPLCSAVDVERLFHKWVDRVFGNGYPFPAISTAHTVLPVSPGL